MRLSFGPCFNRRQRIRRGAAAVLLGLTLLLCVGGLIGWEALVAHPRVFVWHWTIAALGAWGGVLLALWDIFSIARGARLARRKLAEEHFHDETFLRALQEAATKKQKKEKSP